MKGNRLLHILLFYGVMFFAYRSLTNAPATCSGSDVELSHGMGAHIAGEKPDENGHNESSFLDTAGTQPVSNRVEAIEDPPVRKDGESIRKGGNLYEILCRKCHDAYSMQNTTGPGLQGILKNKVLPSSKKPATALNILRQLNDPVNKMPSFHFLSDEEKLCIIAFLNTL